jgi:cell division septation protein DedD
MAAPAEPEVSAQEAAAPPVAEPQASILTHWRWFGLPKPRPPEQRPPRVKPQNQKSQTTGKPQAKPERAPVAAKQTTQPSSLALQLAALKGLKL